MLGMSTEYKCKGESLCQPNPESLIADELWANFFGALTTNNQAVLDCTKKYFPRTYEKMIKLVEHMNDKKQKMDSMKAEIKKFQEGE